MAKLETVIKEAIAREARRQVRVLVLSLRREVLRFRRRVGELQSTLTTLCRSAAGWKRLMEAAPAVPHVSEEKAKTARLSPRLEPVEARGEGVARALGQGHGLTRVSRPQAPAEEASPPLIRHHESYLREI